MLFPKCSIHEVSAIVITNGEWGSSMDDLIFSRVHDRMGVPDAESDQNLTFFLFARSDPDAKTDVACVLDGIHELSQCVPWAAVVTPNETHDIRKVFSGRRCYTYTNAPVLSIISLTIAAPAVPFP